MTPLDDEDERLRSAALQNAQSILHVRQRADEELRRTSEWLRITLASISDGVISADKEGRITLMNGVAETLTGWPQAEALGKELADVFHIISEQSRQPVENPALRSLREGTPVALAEPIILIAKNGTERLIDGSAAPIRDGGGRPVGAVLIFRDVTERRSTEQAKARLAAIVESSDDAIVSKNVHGIILTWNAGAERLFGYKAEEAIGRPITIIIPQDRLDEERVIISRILRGERIEHFDTVRVSKQGRLLDISLTVSPIRDGTGRIIGASKVARDISERKRAEAALRDADRGKDLFIALLAHELRNPLAPLRNGLQVMRLASGDAKAVTQVRLMMERQLGHLVRLIDDLLDISRIGQNKMELRRTRVLLADVVTHAVETVRPVIEAAGHDLVISLPPEPIRLHADLTRLAQVFSNLLTNSAKYTETGGRIWLAAERRGAEVVITVRDTGIGIPADALPHIFNMFAQVDRSVERSSGGLGIGLALVKGLVKMHHGTVTAASEGQGKGSTFTVKLPIVGGVGHGSGVAAESAPLAAGPKRRILVADDNADSVASMAMMLEIMGNEVRSAKDGLQAIEEAAQFHPDVILLDIGMPGLNGYEACRRIRAQGWAKEIVLIALTGWGQDDDKRRSLEAGFHHHLVKPVDPAELEKLLATFA